MNIGDNLNMKTNKKRHTQNKSELQNYISRRRIWLFYAIDFLHLSKSFEYIEADEMNQHVCIYELELPHCKNHFIFENAWIL
jgi:hypothetical protein